MHVDQGSPFRSVRWTNRAQAVGTYIQESGVEAHNFLGLGEIYHAPLRLIFGKIREAHPEMDQNVILKLAVEAVNDTVARKGLVPSYFVFGCITQFSSTEYLPPLQKPRMDAMPAARRKMAIIAPEL